MTAAGRASAVRLGVVAAVLVTVAAANRGLLTGEDVPCFRDIATTQLPARALASRLGAAATNPAASFGQPYHGNPNLVLAYPFPAAPRWMGRHLLLHAVLGAAGLLVFLRRLGLGKDAALAGALSWAFSGFALSSLAFVNVATTAALVPWLLAVAAAARQATARRDALVAAGSGAAVCALLALAGEPVLALLGGLAAAAVATSGPPGTRLRALGLLAAGGLLGALAVAPWLLEVARASAGSTRVARGFSWTEFRAAGLHPGRLLETPFPFFFGDPARVLSGAFWGFGVTQGNPPYYVSLSFGVTASALAVVFGLSPRRREGRLFLCLAALGLLGASVASLPGARALYEALPFLHVLRYPVKAVFLTSLAVPVLAAYAVDRLLRGETLPRFRARAGLALAVFGGVIGLAALAARLAPRLLERLLLAAWDPAWVSSPAHVLAPILERLPVQAALAGALLVAAGVLLARGLDAPYSRLLLFGALAIEGLLAARFHLPRAPALLFETPSPLVSAALAIPGRVYERTGKDVDAVRRGVAGRLPEDEPLGLAFAQTAQGWAQTGAIHGLRYAYDQDPDGSYTLLTRLARDVLRDRTWLARLKWLRAVGVGAVIASDVPRGVSGLVPVVTEARTGVPATLYRLDGALPGLRRLSRVHGSRSVDEAVRTVDAASFDPATDGVVAGTVPSGTDAAEADAEARALLQTESADALSVETSGARPGLLLVDRSFTPRVRAFVNGAPAPVYATFLHLTGVPVPAGTARVEVLLAP